MFFAKLSRKNVEKGLGGNDGQNLCSFYCNQDWINLPFAEKASWVLLIWSYFSVPYPNCITIPAQKIDAVWVTWCSLGWCSLGETTVNAKMLRWCWLVDTTVLNGGKNKIIRSISSIAGTLPQTIVRCALPLLDLATDYINTFLMATSKMSPVSSAIGFAMLVSVWNQIITLIRQDIFTNHLNNPLEKYH